MVSTGRTRNQEENLYILVEILDVLRIGIEAYRKERSAAWLIISARLHQLLADRTNRQLPLALRVIPDLQLHAMKQNLRNRKVDFSMASPVSIHSTEYGFGLEIFDTSKLRIDLSDWFEQIAYIIDHNEITLKQLIEEPRHQAGAVHFDPILRPSTHRIEGVLLYATIGEKQLSFRDYIFAMGEYVQAEMNGQLTAALGNGYRQEGNFDKASEFYEAALQSFLEIEDIQGQSEQWNNKGYLAYLRGDFATAKKFYQTAQQLNKRLGWEEAIVNVNNNLAAVCIELGNQSLIVSPENSINEYITAIVAGKAINDTTHQSVALVNLASAYLKVAKNLEALTAALMPFALDFQIDGDLKIQIERKLRHTIANLSVPFDELLSQIEKEPKMAISLTLGSRVDFDEFSNEAIGRAKKYLFSRSEK
jgi:tetratricopeptide (TPR) repeat protein